MLGSKNKEGEFLENAGLTHSYFDSSWRADGYRHGLLWDSQGGRNISSASAAGWTSLQELSWAGRKGPSVPTQIILWFCNAVRQIQRQTMKVLPEAC